MAGRRAAQVLVAAVVALGAGVAPHGAIAQPRDAADGAPARDPRLARKWLVMAQQQMQRGAYLAARGRSDDARSQFEAAVAAYQRAIDAGNDANLYLDLANAEDRLGRLGDAVKHLRRMLRTGRPIAATGATGATGLRPDVARRAAARLEALRVRVGVVTLTVAPAGASIALAGRELGIAPLGEPLVLLPGAYALSFQAAGHQPRDEEITVAAGSEIERSVALDPVAVVVAPVPPAPTGSAAPDEPPGAPRPLVLGASVTASAAVGAAVLGVLAIRQRARFTAASTSAPDRADARTWGQRLALASDVSLAVAMLAAGATATWYFYRGRPDRSDDGRRPASEAKLDVVPWVQSRSGGAALAGSF